jgi:amino acid transporter
MYTMGRAGTLPARCGYIHPIHRTPTFAIAFVQISGFAAILLVGFLLHPDTIFGFLETIATLAVIVLYAMANLALTSYMRREQRASCSIWQHQVVPWIATLALLPVLFVTVYPKPAWPYSLTPYLFLLGLLAGFAYMQWRELRHPGALRRGAMMLVSTDAAAERGVEPSEPPALQ